MPNETTTFADPTSDPRSPLYIERRDPKSESFKSDLWAILDDLGFDCLSDARRAVRSHSDYAARWGMDRFASEVVRAYRESMPPMPQCDLIGAAFIV